MIQRNVNANTIAGPEKGIKVWKRPGAIEIIGNEVHKHLLKGKLILNSSCLVATRKCEFSVADPIFQKKSEIQSFFNVKFPNF